MKHALYTLAGSISVVFLFGCTAPSPSTNAVEEYQSLSRSASPSFSITGIRHQSLRDAAMSVGARGGLAWRAEQINKIVSRYHHPLDRIFNFNALLLQSHILPPVLTEGSYSYDQSSSRAIRLADRSYAIESQARFVSLPPTWRDYVYLKFAKPEQPDPSMMPKNSAERKVWNNYVEEGWQAGINQADSIFSENLGRLKRDYQGMVRYRNLLAQNIVSPPYVAEVNMGITGNDNEMTINDRIYNITALPSFRYQQKGEDWQTQSSPIYIN
jgi:defect-in-organelle-trafficking protein DotC